MISTKSVQRVLRIISAGKEEPPIAPTAPEEPVSEAKPAEAAVQRHRYYFYEAKPENSIKFTSLQEILKKESPEREAMIEKLKGGNTGKFFADYFRWRKIAVVTNEYSPEGKGVVVYEADLSPIGSKIPGSEKVTPTDTKATPETVEADLLLFSDKRANSNVINIETSSESSFIDTDPPSNLTRILLSRAMPAGRRLPYNEFIKKFDEYRIWIPNLNQLVLPDFDIPKNDDAPGGHYPGGQQAYAKLVGPVEKEQEQKQAPQQPSLGQKVEKEEKSIFEPVTKSTEPVRGDYLDTPSQGVKMANKKSVRNVMFAYLKDAAYSTVTPGTTTQMQGMPKPGEMVSPMTTDTVKNKREFEKRNKAIEDMKKRMSPTTTGTGTPGKY